MSARCKRRIIARGYVGKSAPLTRTLRRIIESGGVILWKDEIAGRVVFRIDPGGLLRLGADVGDFVFEYNLACRTPRIFKINKKNISIINKDKQGIVAYGIAASRYVLIKLRNNRLYMKIGVNTTARRPPSILPPSAFLLDFEDIADIEANLNKIISGIMGEGRCRQKERAS